MTPGDGARPQAALPPAAHPPVLAGAPSIDDSYRSLIDALPTGLRALAKRLPWKLGLTSSPEGGWGDFVGLHPNRELPVYSAQAAGGGLAISEIDLCCYLRAHHLGGFSWLLRDRLEDGQIRGDDGLLALAEAFDQHWREALADAMVDGALAEALCERATSRWQRGTRAEQRVHEPGSLRPPIYAAIVKEKLSWIAVPAQGLLLAHGDARRVKSFLYAHDLFMLGLQAIDDVIDVDQDRALRGADIPSALGCSAGALIRTAPKLVQRAGAAATEAGFTWFANWLDAYADAISSWRLPGDALNDELDAIGIAGEIEDAVLSGSDKLLRIPFSTRAAVTSQ